ncbi:MAG TPA: bifunctional 5,10-methylenetetrahydrofolate dehydrogenase/5,10-methenyltetrahydrofolate cyclohydrolase [Caldilineaceae bacterium]|nr:bifunctional 5,10-methylenetetrahydrofolate dehydrogenase/5,10-methenyltetrahydrofolate cyclohydrolase [Caldilineaceae bacterium]
MSAQLLSGTALANQQKAMLQTEVAAFVAAHKQTPTLAGLRVGDDEAAAAYVRAIERNCRGVGIAFQAETLAADASQAEVAAALDRLNQEPSVHGIMILEPLPAPIDHGALVMMLNPAKDVDGVHPLNAGRLAQQRRPYFVPATPAGGLRLLESAGIDFSGKQAVVVGRSDIVGKPMALLLLHRHCTVTIAHSRTHDLPAICRTADILCVAVGRPEMVRGDWIKPGATVVDFGTTYTEEGLKGDCHQASVAQVAGLLTPVPGGTGPLTNVLLMENVLQAAHLAVAA